MRPRRFVIAVSGLILLSGCAQSGADAEFDSAISKCEAMASEAMPNGMQPLDESLGVLDSKQFCAALAGGYTREKFAELYNDPIWLASELEIWSDEGVP
jgi:hypothetical protein